MAKHYSIEELMKGAASIVDSIAFDVSHSMALETLRADAFGFVDNGRPTKVLPKVTPKVGPFAVAAAALTLITILADIAKREIRGIAIYIQGAYSTETGSTKYILESTQHMADAIATNRPALLHWAGKQNRVDGWYNGKPGCELADKEQYKQTHPNKNPDCDEYPPYAVYEGGPSGDAALQVLLGVGVSLRYIDRSPNRSSGALLSAFTRKCDVAIGEPFAVQMDITNSTSNITRGKREKEGPCYHPGAF